MNNRRNEQSKCKAEYKREYQKRPENKEGVKERMRLYRARKKKERLDAGDIVGTSVNNNNDSTLNQKTHPEIEAPTLKTTDIGTNSQNDHQYESHQTPIQTSIKQEYIQKYSTWVDYERDEIYDRYWFSAKKKFETLFDKIQFDVACDVCDRLWPDTSLTVINRNKTKHQKTLARQL